MYLIQAQQNKGEWVTITQHADQSQAKRMAKLLSVENPTIHRVVMVDESDTESLIMSYEWGKPFIQTDGVQTFVPAYYDSLTTDDEDDDDTPLVFYAIESRLNPVLNELRYTAWRRHNTRRFVDYEEAEASANNLSIQHPEQDFRVVYADYDPLPSIVFRGGVKYAHLGDAPVAPAEMGD